MHFKEMIKRRAVRRSAGILTACCMALQTLTAMPLVTQAATSGTCGPNATWSVTGTTLTISGSGEVTSGSSFSSHSSTATAVVIESGITSLPSNVFNGFSKITSFKMADTVTSIGQFCCYNCISLKDLKLSDNLTEIPASSFSKCRSIEELKLPLHLVTVGASAFYGAVALHALELPSGVTSVGKSAFYGNNIQTLSLGNSLQEIGESAFNLSCFSTVTIPPTIQSIGKDAICGYYTTVELVNGRLIGSYYNQPGTTTIQGTPGTEAERYARDNNLNFEAVGSAHTHSWSDWTVKTPVGCETDGVDERTCSKCGTSEQRVVPATGHSWGEWKTAVAAGCTTDGRNERTCANCGKTESQFVGATGHSWSDWVTEKAPTLTETGLRVRTCGHCGDRIEEAIPKLVGYTITVEKSGRGSVSPSGQILVEAGTNQTITFTPDDGYRIREIVVDGISQPVTDSYTFTTIQANHTISVVFEEIPIVNRRQCIQVQTAAKKNAWCSDESQFSMNDFTITAVFSDGGSISTEDITAQCSTYMTPAQLTNGGQYGIKTLRFNYNGNDASVREYLNRNAIEISVPVYLRGDFNQDGKISAIDANNTLIIYLESILETYETPVTDIQNYLADVDGDGEITAKDAMFILTYYIENEINGNNISWNRIIHP